MALQKVKNSKVISNPSDVITISISELSIVQLFDFFLSEETNSVSDDFIRVLCGYMSLAYMTVTYSLMPDHPYVRKYKGVIKGFGTLKSTTE